MPCHRPQASPPAPTLPHERRPPQWRLSERLPGTAGTVLRSPTAWLCGNISDPCGLPAASGGSLCEGRCVTQQHMAELAVSLQNPPCLRSSNPTWCMHASYCEMHSAAGCRPQSHRPRLETKMTTPFNAMNRTAPCAGRNALSARRSCQQQGRGRPVHGWASTSAWVVPQRPNRDPAHTASVEKIPLQPDSGSTAHTTLQCRWLRRSRSLGFRDPSTLTGDGAWPYRRSGYYGSPLLLRRQAATAPRLQDLRSVPALQIPE